MGRGGYNGGSTIITAWGSGWSRDAQSPIKKKTPTSKKIKIPPEPASFEKQFRNYARSCGRWTRNGNPWQEASKLIKKRFQGDLEAIRKTVLESNVYKTSLENSNKKAKKDKPKAGAKKALKERNSIRLLLIKHAKSCARADLKKKLRPEITQAITDKFSESDIDEWLSDVHKMSAYKSEVVKLKKGVKMRSTPKTKNRKRQRSGY